MLRWLALVALACSSLVLALPRVAQAEKDKAKAVKLLSKGDRQLARGDRFMKKDRVEKALAAYEEALATYEEAYEAFPNPKIYFPIARAEQKLGRYLEAMGHYQAMIKGSENPSKELIAQVDQAIAEVRKNLVALDLIVEQDGALVSVDGEELGRTPLDGPHYMAPGEHKYTIVLEGHTPVEEFLDLKPGEVAERQVRLDALPIKKPEGDEVEKKTPPVIDYIPPSKLPMTISFGAAGAMLLGATFTAIQAKARYDRYQDASLSLTSREKAQESGKSYQLATDALLVGGVLAAGYGTYYYYSSYKPKKRKETRTAVWIAPYAGSEGAGVALGSSF